MQTVFLRTRLTLPYYPIILDHVSSGQDRRLVERMLHYVQSTFAGPGATLPLVVGGKSSTAVEIVIDIIFLKLHVVHHLLQGAF